MKTSLASRYTERCLKRLVEFCSTPQRKWSLDAVLVSSIQMPPWLAVVLKFQKLVIANVFGLNISWETRHFCSIPVALNMRKMYHSYVSIFYATKKSTRPHSSYSSQAMVQWSFQITGMLLTWAFSSQVRFRTHFQHR